MWDAAIGKQKATLTGHNYDAILSLAYSRDGLTLATGDSKGRVHLWDAAIGKKKATLTGHTREVYSVEYSLGDSMLVTQSRDLTVRLWDVATGQHKVVMDGSPHKSVYSPDGLTLATVNLRSVGLLDAATKQGLAALPISDVVSLAYSRDGLTLAIGDSEGVVRLWDAVIGKPKAMLTRHTEEASHIVYSPDGSMLATAGMLGLSKTELTRYASVSQEDREVRLWDVATGKQKATLIGHVNWVSSLAYSPDGSTLATGGADGVILLWNLTQFSGGSY